MIHKRQIGEKACATTTMRKDGGGRSRSTDYLVMGNDIRSLLRLARGDMDLVSTELSVSAHPGSGWGIMYPPVGRFAPVYSLLLSMLKVDL